MDGLISHTPTVQRKLQPQFCSVFITEELSGGCVPLFFLVFLVMFSQGTGNITHSLSAPVFS